MWWGPDLADPGEEVLGGGLDEGVEEDGDWVSGRSGSCGDQEVLGEVEEGLVYDGEMLLLDGVTLQRAGAVENDGEVPRGGAGAVPALESFEEVADHRQALDEGVGGRREGQGGLCVGGLYEDLCQGVEDAENRGVDGGFVPELLDACVVGLAVRAVEGAVHGAGDCTVLLDRHEASEECEVGLGCASANVQRKVFLLDERGHGHVASAAVGGVEEVDGVPGPVHRANEVEGEIHIGRQSSRRGSWVVYKELDAVEGLAAGPQVGLVKEGKHEVRLVFEGMLGGNVVHLGWREGDGVGVGLGVEEESRELRRLGVFQSSQEGVGLKLNGNCVGKDVVVDKLEELPNFHGEREGEDVAFGVFHGGVDRQVAKLHVVDYGRESVRDAGNLRSEDFLPHALSGRDGELDCAVVRRHGWTCEKQVVMRGCMEGGGDVRVGKSR